MSNQQGRSYFNVLLFVCAVLILLELIYWNFYYSVPFIFPLYNVYGHQHMGTVIRMPSSRISFVCVVDFLKLFILYKWKNKYLRFQPAWLKCEKSLFVLFIVISCFAMLTFFSLTRDMYGQSFHFGRYVKTHWSFVFERSVEFDAFYLCT